MKEIIFSSDEFLLKGYLHLPPLNSPRSSLVATDYLAIKIRPSKLNWHSTATNSILPIFALITGVAVKVKHRLRRSHRWMRAVQT